MLVLVLVLAFWLRFYAGSSYAGSSVAVARGRGALLGTSDGRISADGTSLCVCGWYFHRRVKCGYYQPAATTAASSAIWTSADIEVKAEFGLNFNFKKVNLKVGLLPIAFYWWGAHWGVRVVRVFGCVPPTVIFLFFFFFFLLSATSQVSR